ncbi:uncharacterized protein METZ01_LOCUS378427 [marine metagenome]|uniref:Uncharacterized protein n=1 Tax=marine metagenome TaxID=408172 RepID=A0A382TUA1_9ZZZZ
MSCNILLDFKSKVFIINIQSPDEKLFSLSILIVLLKFLDKQLSASSDIL